jgi:3-hydroxyisobutyrate dehydrogenase-like beta-hydroxyacid dehydrogenase
MSKDVRLANQLGQDTAIPMLLGRLVQELHQVALNNHGPNADSNIIIRDVEARSATRIAK